jgi:hypothetical protein
MADKLTTFMCRLSKNLGASNSWNPKGLSKPVMGLLYLVLNASALRQSQTTLNKTNVIRIYGNWYLGVMRPIFVLMKIL